MRERWKKIVFAVAAALSGLMLAYVAYAHVLAASHMAGVAPKDFREGFGGSDKLPPGYDVRTVGQVAWAVRGGVIAVDGKAANGDKVVFLGPSRRVEDGIFSLRFKTKSTEAVEVFMGLEQQPVQRSATVAYVAGPTPMLHAGGDVSGPYRSAAVVEDVKVDAAANEWHLLSLQFSPRYNTAVVMLDGKPQMSVGFLWPQATESRFTFGVKARGDVQDLGVEIESIAFQAMDQIPGSFDDTFNGDLLDPQRWIIHFPDSNLATLDWHLQKGKGFFIESKAVAMPGDHVPLYFVRTPPFALRTLHASADVTVESAHDARIFFGLLGSSAWTTPDKVFDVGISERNGSAVTDVAGAWDNVGVLGFDQGSSAPLPRRMTMELAYDGETGLGRGSVDGKVVSQHRLDLKPLDMVSVRLGSGAHAVGANTRITVHRISLEMR